MEKFSELSTIVKTLVKKLKLINVLEENYKKVYLGFEIKILNTEKVSLKKFV